MTFAFRMSQVKIKGLWNFRLGKGKVLPRTGHEGPEREQMYRSALSLTSALDGGGWSTPRPRPLYPRGRRPGIRCIGGWVDPRAGLDGLQTYPLQFSSGLQESFQMMMVNDMLLSSSPPPFSFRSSDV